MGSERAGVRKPSRGEGVRRRPDFVSVARGFNRRVWRSVASSTTRTTSPAWRSTGRLPFFIRIRPPFHGHGDIYPSICSFGKFGGVYVLEKKLCATSSPMPTTLGFLSRHATTIAADAPCPLPPLLGFANSFRLCPLPTAHCPLPTAYLRPLALSHASTLSSGQVVRMRSAVAQPRRAMGTPDSMRS